MTEALLYNVRETQPHLALSLHSTVGYSQNCGCVISQVLLCFDSRESNCNNKQLCISMIVPTLQDSFLRNICAKSTDWLSSFYDLFQHAEECMNVWEWWQHALTSKFCQWLSSNGAMTVSLHTLPIEAACAILSINYFNGQLWYSLVSVVLATP